MFLSHFSLYSHKKAGIIHAMKQTREINHGDGHTDIETLFGDVWAVTKCNLEVAMYNGYTETQAHTAARAWNTVMRSEGYMRDFRPLNTEAEADAIYAFIQAAEAGDKKTDFNTAANLSAQNWLNKNIDFDELYKSTTERSNALKARIDARMAKAYSIKRGGNG